MPSTAIPQALEALLTLWRGAIEGVTSGGRPIEVCDAEDDWAEHLKTYILVGVRYDIDNGELVGEVNGDQSFPNLSTRSKNEDIVIPHSIVAWSGDKKAAGRRAEAIDLWTRLEAVHRDHNALTIDEPGITVLGSNFGGSFSLRYLHHNTGNAAVLTWDVNVSTRLSHN